MAYRRRVIDESLDELFPHLAAIALEGAKGVGKTATGRERAATVFDLSNEQQRLTIEADLGQITNVPAPVLIDEWQLLPPVWNEVKRAVDADMTGGRFLLAGSADVPPGTRIHSGAARIVSLKMRPLSIFERGLCEPSISLRGLLTGERPPLPRTTSPLRLSDYTDEILASGFPGIRNLPDRARSIQLDSYLTRIVDRELEDNGAQVRRPDAMRSWLTAYGAATATNAAYSTILDAATPGEGDKMSRPTVATYREHLTRLFVLDPIPAWIPVFNPIKRLTNGPKHHLVDPALAARLMGIGKDGLLRGDGQRVGTDTGVWLGALFESLVAQSVRVYAEHADARVYHLRTKQNGTSAREIDLIVEGADRKVVAIEVKLAPTVSDKDVRHLNWLDEQIGDRLADKVIINTGERAYRRPDGVAVIPLALLGA